MTWKISWHTALVGLALALGACTAQLGGPDDGADGPSGGGLSLPGGLELQGQPKYFRVVRLTHAQWESSVRDVLQLASTPGVSTTFIPDPPDGLFSNNERALYVSDTLSGDYQRAAETVAESLASDAAQLAKLGGPTDSAAFIAAVGRRAFRRALTPQEQSAYATLWATGATFYASGNAFADGARVFVEALLQSPNFVYRVELTPTGERLSGLELATKLSYLLRGTTPSDALLTAAESGELDSEEGVRTLVSSLIEEDGARVAAENLHRELFGLDRYRSILKSATQYPNFNETLNPVLLDADLMFFNYVFSEDHGLREILTSDVAFINDATAVYYGLTGSGPALTRTALDGSRPGFLTRLGFLAYNANLTAPDIIHRGVDINNRLLCAQLSPPAGEIPPLPAPVPGQTNRERVNAHTNRGTCAGCHESIINPPGFALESFDAVGQLRTTDNGKPVDTTGTFSANNEEIAFANVVELTSALAENETVHSCYAAHIAEFAFARDLGPGEREVVASLQTMSRASSASVKAMLLTVLTSPEFARARTESP